MKPGSAIINATFNTDAPNPIFSRNAATKGAIQNFIGGLAQMAAKTAVRVNAVAPGPNWMLLIPSTMPEEAVRNFGEQVPMKADRAAPNLHQTETEVVGANICPSGRFTYR